MSHRIRNSVIVVIALLAAGGLAAYVGQRGDNAREAAPVRPIFSTVVQLQPARTLRLAGTIQAKVQTDLGFRMLGRIVARRVNVGDTVTKGDTLASLDPMALDLVVRTAEANLAIAKAQLSTAETAEDRQRSLLKTSTTSVASFEVAQEKRASTQASVIRAEANLNKTREQLSYTELKAEFDGVVTAVGVEAGQVVSAGQTVLTIARPDVREAVIDVPDALSRPLKIGTPFDVALQLDPTLHANGQVREISPDTDPITRTRRVKIVLDNPPDLFRLGATVTVESVVDAAPTLRLPTSALVQSDGKISVWVIDPATGTVSRRAIGVAAGSPGDNSSVVASGLQPGERVATAGVHSLAEGQKVRIDQGASR